MEAKDILKFTNQYNQEFEKLYYYNGNDLGAYYHAEGTGFRIWAPVADKVEIVFYSTGDSSEHNKIKLVSMKSDVNGTWFYREQGDIKGWFYNYLVHINGVVTEVVDPYAKATGVNGKRGMILSLSETNPEGFYNITGPTLSSPTDAIIYELHVRDLSMSKDSGIINKGKYLGFTELGTKNSYGDSTGVSHIKELGCTHVHLLPIYDFGSVDESRADEFNWGYDPLNYNTPEGSYATNPYDGVTRIKELKEAIHALHLQGIGVVMDVVYNHTFSGSDSYLNKVVPYYYHRMVEGKFSDGSACGNETASDHLMMRKYMVDSLVYWAKEYNLDGFRFDLMALHDVDTMNDIRKALNEVNPNIIIYGEGWTGGDTPLPVEKRALKVNVNKMDGIAVFSDDIRDGIKGSVFEELEQGFVNGANEMEETIKFGIVGGTKHSQIDYSKVKSTGFPYALHPSQVINYASAHDNLTLWDKLAISNKEDSEEERIHMNLLSIGIVLTSMGIPFFQAGEELLRSKEKEDGTYDENSYKSPDSINSIVWDRKHTYNHVYEYYKGLIKFRKKHSGLRYSLGSEVEKNLTFLDNLPSQMVGYIIAGDTTEKDTSDLCILHNASKESRVVQIPMNTWEVYVKGHKVYHAPEHTFTGDSIEVIGISTVILRVKNK